ncbi:ATP-dependent endonuclease [Glycocaulis abyssi]
MPVLYDFEAVLIENFRGIPELELELFPNTPTHIIGPNNAGKSTVLSSIALALRSAEYFKYEVSPYDFHYEASGTPRQSFEVSVRLNSESDDQLPHVQGVGSPQPVKHLTCRGRVERGDRLSHRHLLRGLDGKDLLIGGRTGLSKADKSRFDGHTNLGFERRYARHDDIRDSLPEVMHLTPNNISKSLYFWKTGPINRLTNIITDRFLSDEWALRGRQMPDAILSAHKFFQESVEEFPFWKNEVEPILSEQLSKYVGTEASIGMSPTLQAIREWIQQSLLLSFARSDGTPPIPLAHQGDGWQSLVRLAALETLDQLDAVKKNGTVLLFEEPESYLHPHLRRHLASLLRKLASNGWLVVTATHAPEFVDLQKADNVVRLERPKGKFHHRVLNRDSIDDAIKIQSSLDEGGSNEILFAERVILCEGKDDKAALANLLNLFEIDIHSRNVSLISAGGGETVTKFVELLNAWGTPWFAIVDQDHPDGFDQDPKSAARISKLEALKRDTDQIQMWEGDLEQCFLIKRVTGSRKAEHKADPIWQYSVFSSRSTDDIKKEFPQLYNVVSFMETWLAKRA